MILNCRDVDICEMSSVSQVTTLEHIAYTNNVEICLFVWIEIFVSHSIRDPSLSSWKRSNYDVSSMKKANSRPNQLLFKAIASRTVSKSFLTFYLSYSCDPLMICFSPLLSLDSFRTQLCNALQGFSLVIFVFGFQQSLLDYYILMQFCCCQFHSFCTQPQLSLLLIFFTHGLILFLFHFTSHLDQCKV